VAGSRAFLTVKGLTRGASRAEFEYEIPLADGEAMLALCDGPLVEKVRRVVAHAGHSWEIDEFMGENRGLVVAEIELASADEEFSRPSWLGEEVTSDPRYFNSNLAKAPYSSWRAERDA
jgi:CYTH domain-containing protein